MTPQEKAKELVNKFNLVNSKNYIDDNGLWDTEFVLTNDDAKECALIAVEEILNAEPRCPSDVDWDDVGGTHQYYYEAQREEAEKFWQQVKKEIEKL